VDHIIYNRALNLSYFTIFLPSCLNYFVLSISLKPTLDIENDKGATVLNELMTYTYLILVEFYWLDFF